MVLAVCLLAPAGAGLARKLAPGQPAALEPAAVGVVLVATAWLLTQGRLLPRWIRGPIVVWAYFQLAYAIMAFSVDWKIGVAATLIRIAPMLMAPLAYAALRHSDDLRRATNWIAVLVLVLLPLGLIVGLFGQNAVPPFLQPLQALIEMGRTNRAGVPGFAGVFSTFHVLGLSMMAVSYLALANVAMAEAERRHTTRWWLVALAAIALVYLSTRRGAFLGAIIGLGVYLYQSPRIPRRFLAMGLLVVVFAACLEIYGAAVDQGRLGRSRGELLMQAFSTAEIASRMVGVFLPLVWRWLRLTPFGTFLGAAGPEGDAMGWDILDRFTTDLVEVGAAQLVVEMGWAGALLMPVVIMVLAWRLYQRSRGLRCHRAVTLLATFQTTFFSLYYLKEGSAMTTASMAQFMLWAVPGIGAALVERERRERRFARGLLMRMQQGTHDHA